jgi:cytochrome c biogenesis protein CcmG, thiol:disulfide interchange protein DsbE
MKKRSLWLLGGATALLGLLAYGLRLNPTEIPSPLIGKPAPAFSVAVLGNSDQRIGPADLAGKPWLMNVFASWCGACRDEHPVLLQLAKEKRLPLVGLDYRDTAPDAQAWLARLGNPYTVVAHDPEGKVGFDYGVYGVPETFLIDARGKVAWKHIGPLTEEVIREKLLPALERAR